ncbi:MAG: EamA family transporter [Leadbetterella sp.]|nr:EamA family transporter [Leadbetterella sp.]
MRHPYLLLHIAVILAGFTGIFGKLITLNEGLLTWYRVLISSVALFLIVHFTRAPHPKSWKDRLNIALVGLIITIHWLFFYGSIKYSNVSIGVVCYALTSCFTALLVPLINRKRFVFSEIVLSLLTIAGIGLIFHFDTSHQTGVILGVISSVFAALYTIYNEKLVQKFDTRVINFYQIVGGTVGLTLLMPLYLHFFPTDHLIPGFSDTLYLLMLALFCTVGLYLLFAEALKQIPAFTVNLTFNLEPVYAIILAFIIFKEAKEVNFSFYAGLFLVMTSVVLQTMISMRRRKIGM